MNKVILTSIKWSWQSKLTNLVIVSLLTCDYLIKQQDKLELELKKIQQTYHNKFLEILPAGKVFDVIRAEERFHRHSLKQWSGGKPRNKQWWGNAHKEVCVICRHICHEEVASDERLECLLQEYALLGSLLPSLEYCQRNLPNLFDGLLWRHGYLQPW